MAIEYYVYYLYYKFLGFPFVIRVAVIAIMLYAPFLTFAFCSIINHKIRLYKKSKLKKSAVEKYRDKIEQCITSERAYSIEEIGTSLACKVNKLSDKKKRIITNIILELKNKHANINLSNYHKIVEYFNLLQFWENKLKYAKIAYKKKALRKLEDLDIEIPGAVITPLTYHRNRYLRKRARAYYLYFSKNDPYKFFDEDFDNTFNNWDIVEIHRVLEHRVKKEGLPNLSQWLKNSHNNNFKCFLIDEINFFQQKESAPYLIDIIKNDNDLKLIKHSIDALAKLNYMKAEPFLIAEYAMQPVTIQQSSLKAIGQFQTGKALPFLKEAYISAHDVETRQEALRAIYNYGKEGRTLFSEMRKQVSEPFLKILFEHITNPLIKA